MPHTSPKRNLKLLIEYDGTDFVGFQRQRRGRTVQAELETALARILRTPHRVIAAGRTDSGVHAAGQVVNFHTAHAMTARKLQAALNGVLPRDVAVREVTEMAGDFHARFHAKSKRYEYRVWTDEARSPLHARSAYHYPLTQSTQGTQGDTCPLGGHVSPCVTLNLAAMRQAATYVCGRHDFRAFQGKANGRSSTRCITRLQVSREKSGSLLFAVEGNGFLYNMVRNIVGTLLEVGRGKRTPHSVKQILASQDRRQAGPTAPPQGLTLVHVAYE